MPTKSNKGGSRAGARGSTKKSTVARSSKAPRDAASAAEEEPDAAPIRSSGEPVRETPRPEPLGCGLNDPSHPNASDEPVLRIDNIQGNILPGFMKDDQAFLFFTIAQGKVPQFKNWLASLQPFIATTAEVITFNRLFKELRTRRKREPTMVSATWINIAFTFQGIRKLARGTGLDTDFEDEAFADGLAERAGILGDPARNDQQAEEGHPKNWVIGGTDEKLDGVLLLASDDAAELDEGNAASTLNQVLNGSPGFPGGLQNFA